MLADIYAILTERHAEQTVTDIAARTGQDLALISTQIADLERDGKAVAISGEAYLSDIAWKRITDTAQRTLTNFHRKHPYRRRAPDSELRPSLAKAATVRDYLRLKAVLEEKGIWVRESGGARLPDFKIELPPRWEAAAREMMIVFAAGGLNDSPWPGNFRANYPRDVPVDAILDALCERGELVKLEHDLYIAASALDGARRTIEGLAASGTPITVGAVRDATGSSRRVVVPLLEILDKQGITQRQEDVRVLVAKTDTMQ